MLKVFVNNVLGFSDGEVFILSLYHRCVLPICTLISNIFASLTNLVDLYLGHAHYQVQG